MILLKTAFNVARYWLFITLCYVAIVIIIYISGSILGASFKKSFFEAFSDFYVTGTLFGVMSWRIHLFIIFLGTFLSLLNKIFPDDNRFDTYS